MPVKEMLHCCQAIVRFVTNACAAPFNIGFIHYSTRASRIKAGAHGTRSPGSRVAGWPMKCKEVAMANSVEILSQQYGCWGERTWLYHLRCQGRCFQVSIVSLLDRDSRGAARDEAYAVAIRVIIDTVDHSDNIAGQSIVRRPEAIQAVGTKPSPS